MFETIVPLLLFVLPLVACCVFWPQVHKFNKNKDNKRFIDIVYPEHENGVFPNQKTVDLEQILRENDAVGHHREKLIANYKTLRHWIVGYCFCVALLAVSWIVYIIVDIFVCQWKHHELIIFALLGSGLYIWGLGVIPIFKSFGKNNLKKAAYFIDNIMCSFFNPSSKVSDYIIDVADEMIVLILNVILFWGCLQIRMPIFDLLQIESDLIAMTILLCVYQYAVVPVAFLLVVNPLQKLGNKLMQRLGFNAPNPSKKYVKRILKNNTYLLFLLFHFIAKYYQADPASEAGITVEAIGVVYLIDTYFLNWKECRKLKNAKEKDGD